MSPHLFYMVRLAPYINFQVTCEKSQNRNELYLIYSRITTGLEGLQWFYSIH